jgi:hypothetical protein
MFIRMFERGVTGFAEQTYSHQEAPYRHGAANALNCTAKLDLNTNLILNIIADQVMVSHRRLTEYCGIHGI